MNTAIQTDLFTQVTYTWEVKGSYTKGGGMVHAHYETIQAQTADEAKSIYRRRMPDHNVHKAIRIA